MEEYSHFPASSFLSQVVECCIPQITIQSKSICSPRKSPSAVVLCFPSFFFFSVPQFSSYFLSCRITGRCLQERGEDIHSTLFLSFHLHRLRGSFSPSVSPRVLYVSRFGQVGYEGHNHAHVHPCANGDGKSSQEQGSSGAHTCSGEISLSNGLAGLKKTKKTE